MLNTIQYHLGKVVPIRLILIVYLKLCDALNVSVNVMMGIDDNTNNNDTLNENENYLLNTFRNLSVQGQEYILQTIDMVKDKYKKDLYSSDSQKNRLKMKKNPRLLLTVGEIV